MSRLEKVEHQASKLTTPELRRLRTWLTSFITLRESEGEEAAQRSSHTVVHTKRQGSVTYKQELVRCGKKNCKCAKGIGHGPYWYKYYNEGGRTRSEYIGKHLSETLAQQLKSANGNGSGRKKRAPKSRKVGEGSRVQTAGTNA